MKVLIAKKTVVTHGRLWRADLPLERDSRRIFIGSSGSWA